MDNTQTNGQGLCSTKTLFTETGGQPQGCGLQPLALEQSRTGNLRTAVTSEQQKQHLCWRLPTLPTGSALWREPA